MDCPGTLYFTCDHNYPWYSRGTHSSNRGIFPPQPCPKWVFRTFGVCGSWPGVSYGPWFSLEICQTHLPCFHLWATFLSPGLVISWTGIILFEKSRSRRHSPWPFTGTSHYLTWNEAASTDDHWRWKDDNQRSAHQRRLFGHLAFFMSIGKKASRPSWPTLAVRGLSCCSWDELGWFVLYCTSNKIHRNSLTQVDLPRLCTASFLVLENDFFSGRPHLFFSHWNPFDSRPSFIFLCLSVRLEPFSTTSSTLSSTLQGSKIDSYTWRRTLRTFSPCIHSPSSAGKDCFCFRYRILFPSFSFLFVAS